MEPVTAIDRHRMRRNFSGHACEYDQYAAVQARVVARLQHWLEQAVIVGGPVLDIGTGTGGLAAAFHQRHPDSPLVVMDIAHGMTRQASRRLAGVGAADGDAGSLPFRDAAFRTVISSSVYQWVPQLQAAFCEVGRTLKPGGLFGVALFGERTLHELKQSHRRALAETNAARPSHVQSFPGRQAVAEALQGAGLNCMTLESSLDVDYHADVPALLRQLKQIGASNASQDRPRGLYSRRVMQKMISVYEEDYRCEAGVPATYEVIIALARQRQ